MINDLTEYEMRELQAIVEATGFGLNEAIEIWEERSFTLYDVADFNEFIDLLIEDGIFGEIPKNLTKYLDYEKLTKDLQFDGYVMTSVGIIYID